MPNRTGLTSPQVSAVAEYRAPTGISFSLVLGAIWLNIFTSLAVGLECVVLIFMAGQRLT
jgi:hypothetical protein